MGIDHIGIRVKRNHDFCSKLPFVACVVGGNTLSQSFFLMRLVGHLPFAFIPYIKASARAVLYCDTPGNTLHPNNLDTLARVPLLLPVGKVFGNGLDFLLEVLDLLLIIFQDLKS